MIPVHNEYTFYVYTYVCEKSVSDYLRARDLSQKDKSKRADGAAPQKSAKGRITINDIARMANVSKKTVSRILNDHPLVKAETRARVKALMDEHGYAPDPQARALAFRKSFLIGMAYDNPTPQYVVDMQQGILSALEGTEYQLVLHRLDRNSPDYLDRMKRFVINHRPAGIIMPPSVSEDDKIAEMLRQLECRFVRIASVDLDDPEFLVRTHDAEGAAQAARHLARLGHTRIAHIHGRDSFLSAHERMNGFRTGLAEFDLTLSPDLTVRAEYTFKSGVRAADNLLSLAERPTAIFAGNDEMAIGVYTSARKIGLRIPEDLSIVGFDDSPMASRIAPQLTTVRLPITDMGSEAVRVLMRQINNLSANETSSFRPEIIVRQSTAKPAE